MIGQGYVVLGDLYSISARIKEIDNGYFVFYNYKKRRYEVHNAYQRGSTLSLVLPYQELDERAIRLVLQTRRERAEKFLQEMERENETIQKEQTYKLLKKKEIEFEDELKKLDKEAK